MTTNRAELILCAVRGYLRYSLSFRDVDELLGERGLEADPTTIWRWIQRYGPELEAQLRRHLKPTNKSWRVDETYIRIKGRWCYLYRAIDSTGAKIDFVLSGLRDAATAKRLFRKALAEPLHRQPRVINTERAPLYGSAISGVKQEGILRRRCHHRPVQYLNNILEQDHRAIKRRVKAKQGFREFAASRRTIQGYEAMVCHERGKPRGRFVAIKALLCFRRTYKLQTSLPTSDHDGRNRCSGSPESLFRIPESAFTIPESVFRMDRNQCSGWSGIRSHRHRACESDRRSWNAT